MKTMVLIAILVILGWSSTTIGDDKEVATIEGKAIYCRDVTSLSYDEAVREIQVIQMRYGPDWVEAAMPGWFEPARQRFPKDWSRMTLGEQYEYFLVGAVQYYVAARVAEKLADMAGEQNPLKRPQFEKHVVEVAELQHRWNEIFEDVVDRRVADADISVEISRRLEGAKSAALAEMMQLLNRRIPRTRLLLIKCFPAFHNAQPAPTIRGQCADAMIQPQITRIIDGKLNEYVDSLEYEWGTWSAVSLRHRGGVKEETVRELLRVIVGDKGAIAVGGVNAANQIMKDAGVQVTIAVHSGKLSELRQMMGMEPGGQVIRPGTLVEEMDANGTHVWGAVISGSLKPFFSEYRTTPPSFLYDHAKVKIVSDVVRSLDIRILVGRASDRPSMEQIVDALGTTAIKVQMFGKELTVPVDAEVGMKP